MEYEKSADDKLLIYFVGPCIYMEIVISVGCLYIYVKVNMCSVGQETTAMMLTFSLIKLCQHPEVKRRSDIAVCDSGCASIESEVVTHVRITCNS